MISVKLTAAAVCGSALFLASNASAALVHDYELNGNLTDSASGADIVNNGATSTATGLTFGVGQGPTVIGTSGLATYSIATRFSFDTTSGFRKIIDFKDLTTDEGLYNVSTGLAFFNFAFGPSGSLAAGTSALVVLTRDSTDLLTGYVDGVARFSFTDSTDVGVSNNFLRFFQDDNVTAAREASSGFVDYIRIYDTALTATQVAGLTDTPPTVGGAVPEPATWLMMILGFGGIGAALRQGRGTSASSLA